MPCKNKGMEQQDMIQDEGTWRTRNQSERSQVNIKGQREEEDGSTRFCQK